MTDYEFMLEDRISKIRAINEQYDLEHNAYDYIYCNGFNFSDNAKRNK